MMLRQFAGVGMSASSAKLEQDILDRLSNWQAG